MPDLPEELRDRLAKAACDAYSEILLGHVSEFDRVPWEWRAVVDAVAEVLAGHVGCEHLDGPYRRLVVERDDLRVRAERAEAELAKVWRRIGEWAERLDTHDSHGDGAENADRRLLTVIEEMWGSARPVSPDPTAPLSGPAGAAHTEEET